MSALATLTTMAAAVGAAFFGAINVERDRLARGAGAIALALGLAVLAFAQFTN